MKENIIIFLFIISLICYILIIVSAVLKDMYFSICSGFGSLYFLYFAFNLGNVFDKIGK